MDFKVNDYVLIKNDDKIYQIEAIEKNIAYLKGLTYRFQTTSLISELTVAPTHLVEKAIKKVNEIIDRFKISSKSRDKHQMIYGTILHIDGDKEYLISCMDLYKEMNIFANGIYLKESEIKDKIEELVLMLTPDIVVITGHDLYNGKGFKELSNYRNTKHFMDAVRMIRKHFNSESITIIVGACGSNFEALIASGANFSSSPKRINIHTYDPAVIAIKVATTSINQTVDFGQVLKYIENKKDAFGGIETKGKMKVLL